MIVIITTLWLTSSFFLCLFSFWVGRCGRKLPIVDDKLPWTMSRDHAPRCTRDCEMQHSVRPDQPRWPFSR